MAITRKTDLDSKHPGLNIGPEELQRVEEILSYEGTGVQIDAPTWRAESVSEAVTTEDATLANIAVASAEGSVRIAFYPTNVYIFCNRWEPTDATVKAVHELREFVNSPSRRRVEHFRMLSSTFFVPWANCISAYVLFALFTRSVDFTTGQSIAVNAAAVLTVAALYWVFLRAQTRQANLRTVVLRPDGENQKTWLRRNAPLIALSIGVQAILYAAAWQVG